MLVPFCFGAVAGGIASGQVPSGGELLVEPSPISEALAHALAAAGYTVCNRLAKGEWVCLAAKLA